MPLSNFNKFAIISFNKVYYVRKFDKIILWLGHSGFKI